MINYTEHIDTLNFWITNNNASIRDDKGVVINNKYLIPILNKIIRFTKLRDWCIQRTN
jgi:hypothetical protein